jgi:hypothetical protein
VSVGGVVTVMVHPLVVPEAAGPGGSAIIDSPGMAGLLRVRPSAVATRSLSAATMGPS